MRNLDRPYAMTIADRGSYLYVRVEAEIINLDIIVDYINHFGKILRESGHRKMLFERSTPLLDDLDTYVLAANVLRNVVPPGTRIAVVDRRSPPGPVHRAMTRHRNATGLHTADFDTVEEAESWLARE